VSKSLNAIFKKTKSTDKDVDKKTDKDDKKPAGKNTLLAFIAKNKKG